MKKMNSIPLICGLLSIAAFLIYFYSANHAPYSYTDIILLGPVFSFVELIFSIITRKERTLALCDTTVEIDRGKITKTRT